MSIKVNPLPYSYDALEPYISKKSLELHYSKYYKAYTKKINDLIKGTSFEGLELEEIILKSASIESDMFNNAAQSWNHDFYFRCLTPHVRQNIPLTVLNRINEGFGSVEELKKEFLQKSMNLFGSGWIWLVENMDGSLSIHATSFADNPLLHNEVPLLACDLWEHAYFLDFYNERMNYLSGFWQIINWNFVEDNLLKSPPFKPSAGDRFMDGGASSDYLA
jgi:Fe-Mn family superoxide dismutase